MATKEKSTYKGKEMRRKVNVGVTPENPRFSTVSRASAIFSWNDMLQNTLTRSRLKVYDRINGKMVDVTPRLINFVYDKRMKKFCDMKLTLSPRRTYELDSVIGSIRSKSTRVIGVKLSIDDIILGVGSERILLSDDFKRKRRLLYLDASSSDESLHVQPIKLHNLPFVRVSLQKTELIPLFQQCSVTVIKYTDEGNLVEKDNKDYDYLTIGRGKIRRRSDAETQTVKIMQKSRTTNTYRIDTIDTGSYVSYSEMFDTYRLLNKYQSKQSEQLIKLPSNSVNKISADNQIQYLKQLPSFHFAAMITTRILAGNIYGEAQKRFRNINSIERTVEKIDYKYTLRLQFCIKPSHFDTERRGVSGICFCNNNGDIFAVAYGIYSYSAAKLPKTGEVCIWNIKNPCDPERYFFYDCPVVSLEFSHCTPSLLAIGLFDGSVEIRDITNFNEPPIAISQRKTSPDIDPIIGMRWVRQTNWSETSDIQPLLTISQGGCVTRYNIVNGPYLASFKQIVLERVEGCPEGLQFKPTNEVKHPTSRRPQGLNITMHPVQYDIYYALTSEGCLHKCSTNYQNQYLELLKTHEGAVNKMDFSPWSPKLFLTCGNDWCIRVWMDGIFKPILTLKNTYIPYQWAAWSRTHSTVIIGLNRKQIEIWDIRRNILEPMSCTKLENSFNTMARISRDGTCIAIGNEKGNVNICSFEEMPFPPYFQYEALEQAIYKAVATDNDLYIELKSVGNFGYPDNGTVIAP